MAKKKFTDGLESLFGDSGGSTFGTDSPLLADTRKKDKRKSNKRKKRSSGKDFTSDLDTLFQEALNESIDEEIDRRKQRKKTTSSELAKKRSRKPLSGLDALIRRTVEDSTMELQQSAIKRVTFAFDRGKFDKLKSIAKTEKAYLKDILGKIVSQYIDEYEKEEGGLN
ncbi:MAG: hypothetical protein GY705_28080 [Bacteroidetes bacterium]|nr:hypothetical protein [Bacteroidota bacterium]